MSDQRIDVSLVLMPYADVARPSLALGILKACLAAGGLRAAVEHANIAFAELLGSALPEVPYLERLLGEWTFARAAFGAAVETPAAQAVEAGAYRSPFLPPSAFRDPRFLEALACLQAAAPGFVDETARRVLARRPRIVGCSSMFEQHCASLALLRRVKERDPSVVTVLGGANCEAEMGWATIRAFPWVDIVVSGEADELIVPLCRLLLEHGAAVPLERLPAGAIAREHVQRQAFGPGRAPVPRAVVSDLDGVSVPDYDDYFSALASSSLRRRIRPGLLVEASRGCWWGEKHPCTFCGLNGGAMTHRVKSPDRVLAELEELRRRHDLPRFMAVDNILDARHLRTLLPALAKRGAPYALFFETKSNLRSNQVALLKRAGVTWIQAGIEGFHDALLRLMRKGNKAAMNVQTLKYARQHGIHVTWLLLFGFPGEDDAWHAEVAGWLPWLFHLQPPRCAGRVLYDRFSIYHRRPEAFGLRLRPSPSYASIYPLGAGALANLAYFFEDQCRPLDTPPGPGAAALTREAVAWQRLHRRAVRPVLCMTDRGSAIDLLDTRPCAVVRRATVAGLEAEVLRLCEPAITRGELRRRLGAHSPATAGRKDTLDGAIASLAARRVLLDLHGKLLSLPLEGDVPRYCDAEDFPGGNVEAPSPFSPAALDEFRMRMRALVEGSQAGADAPAAPVLGGVS